MQLPEQILDGQTGELPEQESKVTSRWESTECLIAELKKKQFFFAFTEYILANTYSLDTVTYIIQIKENTF